MVFQPTRSVCPSGMDRMSSLVAVLVLTLCACNEELHQSSETFITALEKNDYVLAKPALGPEVLTELDEPRFAQMSATFNALGKLKERTRTGVSFRSGTSTLSYDLRFENGSLELTLTSRARRVDGFSFSEGGWARARDALKAQRMAAVLDALEKGDAAAFDALLTRDAAVDRLDFEKLSSAVRSYGPRASIESTDKDEGKFAVKFKDATVDAQLQLHAGKVSALRLRPREGGGGGR